MLASLHDGQPRGVPVLVSRTGLAETRIAASIRDIGREAWDACFAGEVERYDYLLAVEEAGIEDFRWRYVAIVENGRVIAAMPAFVTNYRLETTVEEGGARWLIRRVRKYLPRFLILRLACLGSPCTETGAPGFHPSVPRGRRPALLAQLIHGFERLADAEACPLRGIKDIPETWMPVFRATFEAGGFAAIPGLATAALDIDFASIDEYLGRLSAGTRKDMRRKLKSLQSVRTENRTDITDVLPRVMALYRDTRERSEWQFEALTAEYFTGVLRHMPGQSFCMLYMVDDKVLAANILVCDGNTLIDKFFCMDAEEGRKHNLYYLSWFNNLNYCLEHGVARYQSGQAYYENKVKLGSRLTANTMFFRHRNRILQDLLRLVSPLFAMEETP
ncbi:GNAT family N-acetyltransferase [Phyllobacterium salinisoli]|uniref:GNAT family N-acetyltransferase n=1 Tax=Phyllobacterium salinisoli TaxID=1899321 RepID=A0A368JZQ4_9HYPH|nr:GNAT family N-acetyltransferase [Phyllobacterium salinisoli]RCS21652.1 GNAT family N-acetyltransferase [Phyllobacterium salinisoli]